MELAYTEVNRPGLRLAQDGAPPARMLRLAQFQFSGGTVCALNQLSLQHLSVPRSKTLKASDFFGKTGCSNAIFVFATLN